LRMQICVHMGVADWWMIRFCGVTRCGAEVRVEMGRM
jgi:hypothetical protein